VQAGRGLLCHLHKPPEPLRIDRRCSQLYVRAKDAAGNTDGTPASHSWTIDQTAPTAPNVGTAGTTSSPTNDTTPTWVWTTGGGGNGTYRYQMNSEAGSWTQLAATTYTPATALTAGTYTLYVQERDAAGNWSTSGSHPITIVVIGPYAPNMNQTGTTATPTADTTPTWCWTSGGNGGIGTYRYQMDSEAGSWTEIAATCYTSVSLDDGAHTLYVQERDTAGNWSASSGSHSITVDTTAPTAPSMNQTGTTATRQLTPRPPGYGPQAVAAATAPSGTRWTARPARGQRPPQPPIHPAH